MKCTGYSYAWELEWEQKIATEYARDNISLSNTVSQQLLGILS